VDKKATSFFTKKELEYLENKKTLKVHVEKDWAPFNFIENGKVKGFANDYMKLLGDKLGVNIQFVKGYTWQEHMNMLKNNEIDIISTMTITPDRKESYIFSDTSILDIWLSIVTTKKNKNLTVEQFDDKKLAVVKGYHTSEVLKKHYPNIKLIEVDTNLDILKSVIDGNADAALGNYAVSNHIINKNFISDLVNIPIINNKYFQKVGQHLALNKQNKLLKNIIDKAMLSIRHQEISKLRNKWINIIDTNDKKEQNEIKLSLEEQKYLQNNKEIKVCIYSKNPPFMIKKENNYTGLSIDFLDLISKKIDLNFNILDSVTIEKHFKMLKDGKCDVSSLVVTKPNKYNFLVPTKPYASDNIVLVTKIDEPYISDLTTLTNQKIMIQKGSKNLIHYVKSLYPNLNLIEVEYLDMQKIIDDKFFGYIGASYQISYRIAESYFDKL
ncbi:MAG: transporter substrate-binding domain-containing protein, partial [Arcobacteraceae bacterium]|nr:transporter substrate-binding domain-containing protein [Arcobacteraceae bacterium]